MKEWIYILLMMVFASCSNDDYPTVQPDSTGKWTTPDGKFTYGTVYYGDLEWMTENLKSGTPYYEMQFGETLSNNSGEPQRVSSYILDFDFEEDLNEYGNLYTYKGAVEACEALGDGWRLPTDEDWKSLEMALGMSVGEASKEGWRGNHTATLIQEGRDGSGLTMQLGGHVVRDGFGSQLRLLSIGEMGYYWSASTIWQEGFSMPLIYYRKLLYSSGKVYRGVVPADQLMRVRCVRNIE